MINARYNERRTDANRGDILSSHDKNQIHVHNHARVHTVSYVPVIIEPFWSFCVINMPKRLFFLITGSEHDETISAGVYHKCYQRRLRGACAFVQSRRVTQSFGVDEESRHLYVLPLISCALNVRASISFLSFTRKRARNTSVINCISDGTFYQTDDTDDPRAASS